MILALISAVLMLAAPANAQDKNAILLDAAFAACAENFPNTREVRKQYKAAGFRTDFNANQMQFHSANGGRVVAATNFTGATPGCAFAVDKMPNKTAVATTTALIRKYITKSPPRVTENLGDLLAMWIVQLNGVETVVAVNPKIRMGDVLNAPLILVLKVN